MTYQSAPPSTPPASLSGRHLLVVEDEYLVAREMVRVFDALGITVVGPTATVRGALDLIAGADRLDGAVLDVNLRDEKAFPVADALAARGVPYIFATGYDEASIPPAYAHIPVYEKPVDQKQLAAALFG